MPQHLRLAEFGKAGKILAAKLGADAVQRRGARRRHAATRSVPRRPSDESSKISGTPATGSISLGRSKEFQATGTGPILPALAITAPPQLPPQAG